MRDRESNPTRPSSGTTTTPNWLGLYQYPEIAPGEFLTEGIAANAKHGMMGGRSPRRTPVVGSFCTIELPASGIDVVYRSPGGDQIRVARLPKAQKNIAEWLTTILDESDVPAIKNYLVFPPKAERWVCGEAIPAPTDRFGYDEWAFTLNSRGWEAGFETRGLAERAHCLLRGEKVTKKRGKIRGSLEVKKDGFSAEWSLFYSPPEDWDVPDGSAEIATTNVPGLMERLLETISTEDEEGFAQSYALRRGSWVHEQDQEASSSLRVGSLAHYVLTAAYLWMHDQALEKRPGYDDLQQTLELVTAALDWDLRFPAPAALRDAGLDQLVVRGKAVAK